MTLRTRLLLTVLTITTVGLAAFATSSVVLLEHSLLARTDDQIDRVADALTSVNRPPPPPPPSAATNYTDPAYPLTARMIFFEPDGALVGQVGVWHSTLLLPPMNSASVGAHGRAPFTVGERDGSTQWRVTVVVQPPDRYEPEGGTAAIAMPLDTYYSTIEQLRNIEIAVGAALLVFLGIISALLVRRGLAPLNRVEHTAQAIADGDIDRRVDDADPRTEVGRLGRAFNVMLVRLSTTMRRLEDSEARLRTFVADASHELRTPLTSIRGYAELYRHGGAESEDDVRRMMSRIEGEAGRMGVLVEDLLLLARFDEQRPLDLTVVDLIALTTEVVQDARIRYPERVLRLHISPRPQRTLGDEHRLRQVITNLVNNAVIHTPATATVDITVADASAPPPNTVASAGADESPSTPTLFPTIEVRDNGPGIPPDRAHHVFDRFARLTRTPHGGSGLGLAIVTAILTAHNARIHLSPNPPHGATFHIQFHPLPTDD
ncbi:sensor histidine kinase [Nocardia macrotermitis]|uniref:sensor histidine kinase n=1 Tax=Nocardia macrotermitis TaxID=2585198 RepID=UPI001297720E|nr:HAMP domain-containing sensor histidine kinase [Nocardia macrotermitis]